MNWTLVLAGSMAIALAAYLMVALLKPERFS